jgi:flagellar biosynthesis protein
MKDNRKKGASFSYPMSADRAPLLVAEGSGIMAKKIITLARKNGVPVHGDRNLIEILSTIDLYEEIPTELYKAVAEILAYIYKTSCRL